MPRSRTSYTTSPTRSPAPSPARIAPSPQSHYELDLDALGFNSTDLDATGLGANAEEVDVVKSDDIEGPEDFTMNMTHWMTADLSRLPVKSIQSRKEANPNASSMRLDTQEEESDIPQSTRSKGDRPILEDSPSKRSNQQAFNSESATVRANGTVDEHQSEKAMSESSMENEEKVLSYLDALPDTDVADALKSTPLRVPKTSHLQVPKATPKASSLQPTVEDYTDTPRSRLPTQQTVIHHVLETEVEVEGPDTPTNGEELEGKNEEELRNQVTELQSRLEQQELMSKTRITELETILSFTRSELDTTRAETYKFKNMVSNLEKENAAWAQQEKELKGRVSSLENANEDWARRVDDLATDMESKIKQQEEEFQSKIQQQEEEFESKIKQQEQDFESKLQQYSEELRVQNNIRLQTRQAEFEAQLQTVQEAKNASDEQLAQKETLLSQLRTDLDAFQHSKDEALHTLRASLDRNVQDQHKSFAVEREELNKRLELLQSRADTLQADLEKAAADAKTASKQVTTAREEVKLAREETRARMEVHGDFTISAQAYISKISELNSRIEELQEQLDASRKDVAAKDRESMKSIQEYEKLEQKNSVSEGRIEGLESTISSLRQQLSEAHKETSRIRTEKQRLEDDLESTNDRLEDVQRESDRRATDIQRKLEKAKEAKSELETKVRGLESEIEELKDEHEEEVQAVREKAEDAVRKVAALLEQKREGKKKLVAQLKHAKGEIEELRASAAGHQALGEEEEDEEDGSSEDEKDEEEDTGRQQKDNSKSHPEIKAKDEEIAHLRTLLQTQLTQTKSLKSSNSTLKTEVQSLKSSNTSLKSETGELVTSITSLLSQIKDLKAEVAGLKMETERREQDMEALNREMDRRLAEMLREVLKDKAKKAVGKRDDQWVEKVEGLNGERQLMGKVLMNQWGKEECGEKLKGEGQAYRYKYVKRSEKV